MTGQLVHIFSRIKNLIIPTPRSVQIIQLNRLYATLSRINHIIVRVKDRDRLFQEICEAFIDYGEFRMAWIGLLDADQVVRPVAKAGSGLDYLSTVNVVISDKNRGKGPVGRAVREKRIIFCQDISSDPLMKPWREEAFKKGYKAMASVPIRQNSVVIGAFSVYAGETMAFDEKQLSLIREIGVDISFALDILEIEKERKKTEQELIIAKEKAEANEAEYRIINEELLKTKELVEQSEKEFRLLSEAMPQIVWITRSDGHNIYFNQQWVDYTGMTMQESYGDGWNKPFHPDDKQRAWEAWSTAINNKKAYSIECRIRKYDGSYRWWLIRGVPIFDMEGRISKWFGTCTDIQNIKETEIELIRAKEKAEDSDRLKTAFLQNMSHEIRTPMNAIMGFSALLKYNLDNRDKLEKFSGIINQRCNDLLRIINDILDIAKIESGQLPVDVEECNLPDMFEELRSFFNEYQVRLGKSHIKLNLKCACGSSGEVIVTDKVKLKQIFINLLTNAYKFTDEGTIEGGCKTDGQNKLIFYVSDTGIGIPADKHELIFERFTQLNQPSGSGTGGTGLGLPIVKGLVNLLGGMITLRSEPGKGSTFTFTVSYRSAMTEKKLSRIEYQDKISFSGKTILVVEDDIYNAEYIHEILSRTDVNILHADNGTKAVELIKSGTADLVLMDIKLPDISGYEAISQIKQYKPDLKIIVQSAYASADDQCKAFNAGCNDYISKPIDKDSLLFLINKYIH